MKEYKYPDFMPQCGQPIMVRNNQKEPWFCGIFSGFIQHVSHPWTTGNTLSWKYAAPYDEQVWLNSQKTPVEKLAEVLAKRCTNGVIGCPLIAGEPCIFGTQSCYTITKEDWLAWAGVEDGEEKW